VITAVLYTPGHTLLRAEQVASLATVLASETPSLQLLWLDAQSRMGTSGITSLARLVLGAGAPFLRLLNIHGSLVFQRGNATEAMMLAVGDALAKRKAAHMEWRR